MALYKRGGAWWFEFVFNGERIRESTKQGNRRTAEQIEAARRTQLAKGEVGINDRKPVPTLKEFAPRFERAIEMQCGEKPRTVEFYKQKLATLLADERLISRRIDSIDEAAIEDYVQRRGRFESRRGAPLSAASINRELATLRRLLRLAHEWKEIQRIPRIRLLRGEHSRESIMTPGQEVVYFAACPSPLADVALLLLDTGLRLGEALSLEWTHVKLEPAQGAKFGYLTVSSGKAKSKKSRNVPLSERSVAMLLNSRARGERLRIPPDGRIAVAEQSPRPATFARANAAEAAFRLRAAFVAAYVRNAIGRVRGGRVHYNATDGAFDGNGFSAVRSSFA